MAKRDRKLLEVIRWLLDIVAELLPGPRTLAELQLLPGAVDREPDTIKRDIMLLRDLGWEIPKNQKAYRIEDTRFPLLVLPGEADGLQRVAALARRLELPESEALDRLVARLPAGLRRPGPSSAADYAIGPASANFRQHAQTVRRIERALLKGQRFEALHRRADRQQPVRYECDAGRLHWEQGSVYFVGYVRRLDKPGQDFRRRELRVDRIQEVRPLAQPRLHGAPPDLFAFRFWASPRIVPFLADTEAQRVVRRPDGSAEVVAKALDLLRATQRVLAYGGEVRATLPAELVEAVARELSTAASLYAGQTRPDEAE